MNQALQLLSSHDESYHFRTGTEVNKVSVLLRHVEKRCSPVADRLRCFSRMPQLMDAVMLQLTRARNRLTTPASLTLPELATSGLMVLDVNNKHNANTTGTNQVCGRWLNQLCTLMSVQHSTLSLITELSDLGVDVSIRQLVIAISGQQDINMFSQTITAPSHSPLTPAYHRASGFVMSLFLPIHINGAEVSV